MVLARWRMRSELCCGPSQVAIASGNGDDGQSPAREILFVDEGFIASDENFDAIFFGDTQQRTVFQISPTI